MRRRAADRRTVPPPRGEGGQALPFFVLALVALLGLTAFVVDVGHAYFVQRSLQASADAAATAGARELPSPGDAVRAAREYSGSRGGKNERGNVPGVTTTVTPKCISIAPCHPVNAVSVTQTAKVKTLFARVLGIDSFTVKARATACSPCGAKPLDVVLVLDRTGSMCEDPSGRYSPACTDLNNARNGMKTFLRFMNPTLDSVALAVFPPAIGSACTRPETVNYHSPSAAYVVVPLSSDYLVDGELNDSSRLVAALNCQTGWGRTAYATAIDRAQAELDAHGRPDARDVIVFLSDGGANIGPEYYGDSSPYRRQPCHQGIWSAASAKARGTLVYTIGYDLGQRGADICQAFDGSRERPSITGRQALQQMASSPDAFFEQPTPGELDTIYTEIAVELTGTRLIDDESA